MKKFIFSFLIAFIYINNLSGANIKKDSSSGFQDPINGYEPISWTTPYGNNVSDKDFFSANGLDKAEKEAHKEILRVEKIQVIDCRAVRGFTAHPIDGRVDSRGYAPRNQYAEWPFRYSHTAVSYGIISYHGKSMADGLHIKLRDKRGFNGIIIRSQEGFKGSLLKDNNKWSPPWNGIKICDFDGNNKYLCRGFNELIASDKLSFIGKEDQKKLGNIEFLRIGKFASEKKYTDASTYYFNQESGIPDSLKFYFNMHFNKDKNVNYCSTFPPLEKNSKILKKGTSGYSHFILSPQKREIALGAIRMHFNFIDFKKGERAIISVQDPLSPKRDLISYAYPIDEAGKVNAELDFPDQIILPNRPLWIRVRTSNASLLGDARIILLMSDKEIALKEYLQYRLTLLKGNFATRSEPRVYGSAAVLPNETAKREALIKNNRYGGEVLKEMYESLDELKRLYPEHPEISQYYDWIYYKEGNILYPKNMSAVPVKTSDEKNAPDWAVAIRNGIKDILEISEWWLDNRQIENGEFGGMTNDDTCLLQQFYGISLLSDGKTGKRIKEACRKLNELAQKNNLEEGVNKTIMDPLHGYEEGINMASTMPLLFYGDPIDFERLMLSARSIEKLTFNKEGKRYFKKYFYNTDNIRSNEKGYQHRWNVQLLHPATMLVWYNKNEKAADFINSVIKGLIAFSENGMIPEKINVKEECPAKGTKYVSILGYLFNLPIIAMTVNNPESIKYLKNFLTQEEYSKLQERAFPEKKPVWMNSYPYQSLNGLVNRISRDNRKNRHFKYIYTKAEIFIDRLFIDQQALLSASIGTPLLRNSWAPIQYASYEKFGENFAPLLLETKQNALKIAFYNFNEEETSGAIRVWRLEHGNYRIETGPDSDNNGKIDEIKKSFLTELQRYSSVSIKLPPKQTWIIKISQMEKLDDIRLRPDLAISIQDLKVEEKTAKINFTVHNIGAEKSGDFTVLLYDENSEKLQEIHVKQLDAPIALSPRKKQLYFKNIPMNSGTMKIVIDPENKIKEITKSNNIIDFKIRN
jgi:CARDB protein